MTRERGIRRSAPLAVALCLGLSGSLVAGPAVAEEKEATTVRWGDCPEDVAAEAAPVVLECGTVPVPKDYADPDGDRIELMISRLASTDPDRRRGTLMLNPGGPGGSGLSQPAFLANQGIPSEVLDTYDVIGTDTRGIGRSAPVACGFTRMDPTSQTSRRTRSTTRPSLRGRRWSRRWPSSARNTTGPGCCPT